MSSMPERPFTGSHTPALSDSEAAGLVARVRLGDEEAFRRLFEAWFPLLVTLVYHYIRSADAAHDVVQDVFVKFWNDRLSWQWEGSAFGYLQLVARRQALNVVRRARLEAKHGELFVAEGVSPASGHVEESGEERVLHGELWSVVSEAIAQLPPRTRAVAILRWFEGLGRQEAAAELGVSVRTVDVQLGAAAKAVRIWLQQHGFGPTAKGSNRSD
ncbi:MAG TPA: sigma-70 family RNA polymerase sigma factor [Gemmatimonadaceae bacterium]|jgi:RNA polymerase sigma factor (sigma-70 family)|nr:sigma-70 family RNA polymerase sigma factor [Gemmatimonadaceae bacterium]